MEFCDGPAFTAGKIREFGTQSGTLIPIERGACVGSFQQKNLGGIVRQVRSQRPPHSPSFFPSMRRSRGLLSLRDQGRTGPSFAFAIAACDLDAGTLSERRKKLISAGRNPPSWFVNLHQIGKSVLPVNLIHPRRHTRLSSTEPKGPRAPFTGCISSIHTFTFNSRLVMGDDIAV